jgi:AraC-like DNA-binding protein
MNANWQQVLKRALSSLPELVRVDRIALTDRWSDSFHSSITNELVHVLGGRARIELPRRPFSVGPGDTFIVPCDTKHRDVFPRGDTYSALYVFFRWDSGRQLLGRMDPRMLCDAPAGIKSHLHWMIRQLESEYLGDAPQAPQRMQMSLLEILLCLARCSIAAASRRDDAQTLLAKRRRHDLAAQIHQYLQEHYDRPVNLDDLAAMHNVSPFHLCRTFSQEFQVSMTEMLASIRVERAKDLLAEPAMSIKQVSAAVGFTDSNYFAKVFRKVSGGSPSQFRLLVLRRAEKQARRG